MELKIGDFGLATKLEFEGDRRRTICGTPNYIAPEILDGKQGHSYEVDIWSFGVILYTLIVGKPPFETPDVKTTYKRIKMNAYSFPDNVVISENARGLITRILKLDPAKRPRIDDIYDHCFFRGNVPKLLPASTLACPPSLAYLRQFLPPAEVSKTAAEKPRLESTAPIKLSGLGKEAPSVVPAPAVRPASSPNSGNCAAAEEKKDSVPAKASALCVKKWVDYSSKYGLGYLVSNGATGVFFNDSTKIVLDPQGSYSFLLPI